MPIATIPAMILTFVYHAWKVIYFKMESVQNAPTIAYLVIVPIVLNVPPDIHTSKTNVSNAETIVINVRTLKNV